jgi:mono/diheme cytochrome c family protein/uncharacterized cupredoxin-like copper-binding protein
MSDENAGRELTPRESGEVESGDSSITPAPEAEERAVQRFSAGPRAHTVGLTEERSAQIVRQSGNARNVIFLGMLLIALFIPIYWFYESGIPAVGAEGRLGAEVEVQYVTDVSRGYELYLANCARCHGDNGGGGVGPPLNDQPKLYNALTIDRQAGPGHLNPVYIEDVLTVGGRYICGDPDSAMDAWVQPGGPLNYRQVEELTAWLTASSDISFEHEEESHGGDEEVAEAVLVRGWRDPNWEPEPSATPPPACWRAPDGLTAVTAGGSGPTTDVEITPGTPEEPRVIQVIATAVLTFTDEDGVTLSDIPVVAGETVTFEVTNEAGFDHNFYLGPEEAVMGPGATTDFGIPTWTEGTQTLTVTAQDGTVPIQFACTVPGHYGPMHGDIVVQG